MEYFDELNENGEKTGKKVSREDAHKNGNWHKAVLIFVLNKNYDVLMQKRSKYKKLWPGKWDGTGGGHVDAGEMPADAVKRELKEELGIDLANKPIKSIGKSKTSDKIGDVYNRHFNEFFVTIADIDPSTIKLQESEVENIRWISFDEFKKWVQNRSDELTTKWEAFDSLVDYVDKKRKG